MTIFGGMCARDNGVDILFNKMLIQHISGEKQGEQKPTIEMKSAEESLGIDSETYNKIVDECIYGDDKQKPAWSCEDEERIKNILSVLDVQVCWDGATGKKGNPYQKEISWLKSIKSQPKQEWSEEDEKMIGRIRGIVEAYAFSQSAVDVNGDLCEKKFIDVDIWLKSLKPQNTWKPSDEQMKALDSVIDEYDGYPEFDSLVSLKNDLRKL